MSNTEHKNMGAFYVCSSFLDVGVGYTDARWCDAHNITTLQMDCIDWLQSQVITVTCFYVILFIEPDYKHDAEHFSSIHYTVHNRSKLILVSENDAGMNGHINMLENDSVAVHALSHNERSNLWETKLQEGFGSKVTH